MVAYVRIWSDAEAAIGSAFRAHSSGIQRYLAVSSGIHRDWRRPECRPAERPKDQGPRDQGTKGLKERNIELGTLNSERRTGRARVRETKRQKDQGTADLG